MYIYSNKKKRSDQMNSASIYLPLRFLLFLSLLHLLCYYPYFPLHILLLLSIFPSLMLRFLLAYGNLYYLILRVYLYTLYLCL